MIKSIIFDFDGTLIDSKKANLALGKLTLKHFKQKHKSKDISMWYKLATKEIIKYFFPIYKRRKVFKFLEKHRSDFFHLMKINKNVKQILKYLKNKYKLALVTNRAKSTYGLLHHFKLANYFDVIVTANMIRKHKPYPNQINYAKKKLKLRRNEILYIGDAFTDSIAAKKAKVKCIIYKNNKLKADFHINDFIELKKILNKF